MKTLTMRVDDTIYEVIKLAASGEKRNIANFIEFATMQYLNSSAYVDEGEMDEILADKSLLRSLKLGKKQLENGEYDLV